ncbi:MAG TPA: heme lyase CcmF/NrfE family subunit, partial [Terracidiphilus sp.]
MATFGSLALIVALALAAYNLFAGAISLRLLATGQPARVPPERLADTARRAGIAGFLAVTAAAFALVYSALTNDFSITYIVEHSNRALDLKYKFAALWSGQEGSLLLWAWLLGIYGFILRLRHKTDVKLFAYAGTILAGIQVFFLAILNFAAPPFSVLKGSIPTDGNGLNPLLQYPEMVIHPPMLYLGYVGFSVPFAFGLGALMMRYPGEKWIKITRIWTLVTWLFLSCGVFLGMHWAYAVLGWGGYWGWDPVENASFMPWLAGTAFLHSVMMQEKRGMMKQWNMWLIFTTFFLAIFGTFLTRSGVVSSVHAFAQSGIGVWFVWFLAITAAVCVAFFILNYKHLRTENHLESLISRESSFLFNNLLLLVSCFAVLWGTLFPVISEAVTGSKVTVGAPFFNRVNVPIAMFLLVLTGIGPLLAWRKTSLDALRRNFLMPAVITVVALIVLMAMGMHPWQEEISGLYSLMGVALSIFVIATVASEFYRGGRVIAGKQHTNVVAGMVQLTRRNTRRYGGYIVHLGVVIIVIGFCGAAFNQDKEQELPNGKSMTIGSYTLTSRLATQDDNANYESEAAVVDVYKHGKQIDTLYPERRVYHATNQPATMVANRSTLREDLYVVYAGSSETGHPILKVHLNPLVMWIWIGVWFIIAGTGIALVPNMQTVRVMAPVRATA